METFYLLVSFGCLLIVLLAMNVSRLRYKERIAHGDRDNKILRNAIQAHANAIEQILPFCLIIFVLAAQHTSTGLVQFLVFSFLVLRLAHAIGMTMFIFRAWQIASAFSYFLTILASGMILYNLAA